MAHWTIQEHRRFGRIQQIAHQCVAAARVVRRWLTGVRRDARDHVFARQRRSFEHAYLLVTAFYCANLYFGVSALSGWRQWRDVSEFSPLWPVAWLDAFDVYSGVCAILALHVVGALGAAVWPHRRALRLVAFLGLFQFIALTNSFGKINHGWHAWLWTAFFLVWLPSGTRCVLDGCRRGRQMYLNAVWGALFAVLLFYSMSGVWKLAFVPLQLLGGEPTALSPDALARHVANRLKQTNSESPLGHLLIDHLWLSWPMYLATLYLETFAVVAAFRPSLQRSLGVALLGLHIGIGLTMSIWFHPPVLLVALLVVNSPFARTAASLEEIVADLPLVAWVLERLGPQTCSSKAKAQQASA